MRRLSFIIAITGIFALTLILYLSSPAQIQNTAQLSDMEINTKVQVSGVIISEKIYGNTKIILLDNGVELACDSCPNCKNKTLSVLGTVQRYQNKTQVKVLRITTRN